MKSYFKIGIGLTCLIYIILEMISSYNFINLVEDKMIALFCAILVIIFSILTITMNIYLIINGIKEVK